MVKSFSTYYKFCLDSASCDLEKGIDFKSSDVFLPLDIISNILSRLPVRSILRFRFVCKQWHSLLTDDSHFIIRHYCASLKRPMLMPTFAKLSTKVPLYALGPGGDIKDISVRLTFGGRVTFLFSNPVNGLVYTRGYLLNPFTRDVIILPKSRRWGPCNYVGLGFDESLTGHYKLVRLISMGNLSSCACEVLTVGTREWRYVGNTPRMRPSGYPVFLNGAVHWLVCIRYEPLHLGILAFDIKHEKFQLISIPVAFPYCTSRNSVTLQELSGYIYLLWDSRSLGSRFRQFFLEIWMLKDYDKNEWEQEYNIDMSKWVKRCHFQFYATHIIEVRDGRLLIQNSGRIYSYDFQSKFLRALSSFPGIWTGTWDGICRRCHVIIESLVSPRKLLKHSINS